MSFMKADLKKYSVYALWIVVFEAVSMVIGRLTQGSVDGWYASLTAPPLVPPNFVFPIMWTILYALIAIVGCRLWQARHDEKYAQMGRNFFIYMIMNWSWSFIFFSAHALLPSFIWIVVLNIVALDLIMMARKHDAMIAKLMIPTVLWTLFAAYLNGGYWYLNN